MCVADVFMLSNDYLDDDECNCGYRAVIGWLLSCYMNIISTSPSAGYLRSPPCFYLLSQVE